MRLSFRGATTRVAAVLLIALAVAPRPASPTPSVAPRDDDPRVYLKLVRGADMPFAQVASTLEAALSEAGWTILSRTDAGVDPSACSFKSRVVVAVPQGYGKRLLSYGSHAAFAVPIRFVVWEDEEGVGVGATNPMNLNRTIVDEASSPEDWADVVRGIRAVTSKAFPRWTVNTEYGQERGNARIGRTMGIMAGGKFNDKLEDVLVRPAAGATPAAIADRLMKGLASVPGDWEWGIRGVYVLDMPEHGMTLLGVTGDEVERRSFDIVKHGGDGERKDMACPGIDHAAAYPVEIAISVVGGELRIQLVDEMYRMKMFFEDAGKMSFAKNMGMPGSIEDEIRTKILAILN